MWLELVGLNTDFCVVWIGLRMVAGKQESSRTSCSILWKANAFFPSWVTTRYVLLSEQLVSMSCFVTHQKRHVNNWQWFRRFVRLLSHYKADWELGRTALQVRTRHIWVFPVLTGGSDASAAHGPERGSGSAIQQRQRILTALPHGSPAAQPPSLCRLSYFTDPLPGQHNFHRWLFFFFFFSLTALDTAGWFSELNLPIEEAGGNWAGARGARSQRRARKVGLLVLLALFHHQAVPFELKGVCYHRIC